MLKKAISSNPQPHSALMGSAMVLLVVGVMSLIPDFDEGKFINLPYVTLLFSTAMLSIWGSGLYLHMTIYTNQFTIAL